MKFTAAVLASLAAVASAIPAFTNTAFDLKEGQPITLTWSGATGPVNIQVVSGPNKDSLVPVLTIGSGLTSTSLTYTPSGLPSGNYAFKIVQPSTGDENYSILITNYVGTGSTSTLASTTRTTTGTTTRMTSSSSSTEESSSTSTTGSTSTTSTRSTTTTAAATTRATNAPTNNNEGQRFSSSLALVFITVAALVFFN